jgi:hypothetical protein
MANQYVNLPAFGYGSWKAPVANAAALPSSNNTSGDVRVALDTGTLWEFNGTSWQSDGGSAALLSTIGITINGGGSVITTGVKGFIYIPYACTINSVTLLASQSGSCVIDI